MRILVWDWPVRVFHWLLVIAFAGAWLTSGDDRYTYVHAFCGYSALLLVIFRIIWGFTGTRHAQFRSFAASPAQAFAYLRDLLDKRASHYVTHNPVGSWAVWMLLSLTLALALSGLLALGSQEQQGPLAGVLDRSSGGGIVELHEFIAWAGVALIAMHILGVIAEGRVHHENLVRAMFDGRKDGTPTQAIISARPLVAMLLLAGLSAFSLWYFHGYFTQTAKEPFLPYTSAALPGDAQWQEECGSCHLAYHPSLLRGASWRALFVQQQDHFGEDLMLDRDVIAALQAFALAHSAEHGESEAAVNIAASTPHAGNVLRITATPYWKSKHADIADSVWKTLPVHGKGDCAACHADAEAATFEDGAMRLP